MVAAVKSFKQNMDGNDYIVGDIHGCFHVLETALKAIGFNRHRDRLFCLGDLVNRGPYSANILNYINEPWFHSIRGNHEESVISEMSGKDVLSVPAGDWLCKLNTAQLTTIFNYFNNLPIAFEIKTSNGKVGCVHGDITHTSWNMFCGDLLNDGLNSKLARSTIWKRTRIKYNIDIPVEGVRTVFAGHTPVSEPCLVGNVAYIDTGCCYGKYLTIANAASGHTFKQPYHP